MNDAFLGAPVMAIIAQPFPLTALAHEHTLFLSFSSVRRRLATILPLSSLRELGSLLMCLPLRTYEAHAPPLYWIIQRATELVEASA
jgi:hypothetical protein